MATVQVPKEELMDRARAFNADAHWFAENLDKGENLRSTYAERYVAVHNERAVDSDKDLRKLLLRLKDCYSANEIGSFFVEYVTRTKINLII